MPRLIDLVRSRVERGLPVPLAATLEMRFERIEDSLAVVSMPVSSKLFNPIGTLHGGIYCDLADMAMGTAMMTTLGDGEAMTTIELKINYFRPVLSGELRAEARVLHRGRTSGFIECTLTDQQGRLAAKATSTCVLLPPDRAAMLFAHLSR